MVRDGPPDTPLTARFKSNAKPERQFGKHLLYGDYAELFTYHFQSKEWKVRKKMVDTVVGCMHFIMPNAGELYILLVLLNHVPGATSYSYLRTVEGTEYAMYQQACICRGLLQDDDEWHACLEEAVGYYKAARLRLLFCTILEYNSPKDPYKLYLTFEDDFIGDLMYHAKKKPGKHRLPSRKDVVNDALTAVERILQRQGFSLTEFRSMPLPVFSKTGTEPCKDNDTWTIGELQKLVQERVQTLTNQQCGIFDEVTTSTSQNTFDAKCFFMESCGGCGKTYLNNLLLAYVRSKGSHAIAVASSGIASLLSDDGTTGHSAFGIPVTKGETSSIPLESTRASFLRDCKLIVWDEAPMADDDCFRVLDELLRDIMRNVDDALHVVPFGGKTVVMTGNWRHILLVLPRGSRAAIGASTLKKSYPWPYFKTLRLTTNIRVEGTDVDAHQEARAFSNWLWDVCEGKVDNPLSVPPDMLLLEDTMESTVDHVFPKMGREELISGCILAPLN